MPQPDVLGCNRSRSRSFLKRLRRVIEVGEIHMALTQTRSLTLRPFLLALCAAAMEAGFSNDPRAGAQSDQKKEDKKKPEPFKIQKVTQGMGFTSFGPLSPNKKSIILMAHKPEQAPNLYV